MFNGKIHYKWPFSIAMLVYQRVNKPKALDCPGFMDSALQGQIPGGSSDSKGGNVSILRIAPIVDASIPMYISILYIPIELQNFLIYPCHPLSF